MNILVWVTWLQALFFSPSEKLPNFPAKSVALPHFRWYTILSPPSTTLLPTLPSGAQSLRAGCCLLHSPYPQISVFLVGPSLPSQKGCLNVRRLISSPCLWDNFNLSSTPRDQLLITSTPSPPSSGHCCCHLGSVLALLLVAEPDAAVSVWFSVILVQFQQHPQASWKVVEEGRYRDEDKRLERSMALLITKRQTDTHTHTHIQQNRIT